MSSTGGWRSRLHRLCPRSLVRRESTSYLVLPFRYGHHKSAHAASAEIPNENQASSSNSHSQPPHDYSHPRKGKQRDQDSYRFPARGSRGGLPDPFEVLGLDRSASDKEIKQQYYRLAQILHPDSSHPSSSPDHFATLHRAYALLSSPSTRQTYAETGYGWSSSDEGAAQSPMEAMMRQEVLRRARGGASSAYRGKSSRYSEAGRGAWEFGDFMSSYQPAEPKYMSKGNLWSILGLLGGTLAWIQWHRLGMVTEKHREMLDQSHLNAAVALAAARDEAKQTGQERRERIKRMVKEQKVIQAVERLESGAETAH